MQRDKGQGGTNISYSILDFSADVSIKCSTSPVIEKIHQMS